MTSCPHLPSRREALIGSGSLFAWTQMHVLESGRTKPGADTGWLNRALVALASDGRVDPQGSHAIGVGPVSQAPVMSWAPQQLLPASEDAQARLLDLYRHTDTKLAAALEARIQLAALGRAGGIADAAPNAAQLPPGIARVRAFFAEAAGTAARYLARPEGPRVGALGFVGWDTHINEGAAVGQLANLLGALDGALAAIETNMDDAWRETVVAVVTEFRPHCPHQRHGRHGPRYWHGRAVRWRRAQGRAGDRGLAGPPRRPICMNGVILSPRLICAPC
jgi:uncharacterized protein (DUF1501 family)